MINLQKLGVLELLIQYEDKSIRLMLSCNYKKKLDYFIFFTPSVFNVIVYIMNWKIYDNKVDFSYNHS